MELRDAETNDIRTHLAASYSYDHAGMHFLCLNHL
jgi:hypothetical protein